MEMIDMNRPFPSSLVPLFQSESKCETILMKMTDLHENETACKTHFHKNGFALRLVLKQRHKRTRKWPINDMRCELLSETVCKKLELRSKTRKLLAGILSHISTLSI